MKKIRCEIFSIIAGYFRPVKDWNKGKKQEFIDRKTFSIEKFKNNQKNKS